MKKKVLTASTFRMLLIISLVLIIAACVAVVVVAKPKLQTVATDVSHAVVDAEASSENLSKLKIIERELSEQRDTITRTNKIVADSQSYQYQNQIIADLNKYAKSAGVSIADMNFGSESTTEKPAAKPATGGAPSAPAPSGVKMTSVAVSLKNPVDYKKLLVFIRLIEQNLTKMQISDIDLSTDTDSKKVSSDALTIEVYIK